MNKIKQAQLSLLLLAIAVFTAHSQEVVDYAGFRASYQFLSKSNTSLDGFDKSDVIFVDIGSQVTKSYSRQQQLRDSITSAGIRQNLSPEDIRTARRGYPEGDVFSYYHRFPERKSTVTAVLFNQGFVYEEAIIAPQWSITNEEIEVLGYLSRKATANYLGREWTVYFAPEIPINQGPWRLWGLPGLIVKAYDSENFFLFELTGFEEVNGIPIIFTNTVNNGDSYQKTSKSEFIRFEKIYYADPINFFQAMTGPITVQGGGSLPPPRSIDFIPLEPWD